MKKHSLTLFWFLYWCAATLLFITAFLLVMLRLLLPLAGEYRSDIEQFLSQQLESEVRIASLNAGWDGWKPELKLSGLTIEHSKEKVLSAAVLRAEITFDPTASLRVMQPVFSKFQFSGVTVRAKQQLEGPKQPERVVAKQSEITNAGSALLTFLLHQTSIRIDDARFEFTSLAGESVAVAPIFLRLQYDGKLHQLTANSVLKTDSGRANINFIAEASGAPSRNPVDFYLRVKGLDHELINPWLNLLGFNLDRFSGQQEIWGQSYRGKLLSMIAKTHISEVAYAEYTAQHLILQTALLRRDQSYQLQLTDLSIGSEENRLQLPTIGVDLVRYGQLIKPKQLQVDKVDLAEISSYLQKQALVSESIGQVLQDLAPQGVIENIKVTWSPEESLKQFRLLADLRGLAISAWDDIPELRGINGLLKADVEGGEIHLRSNEFGMSFPTLFEYRWQYPEASGIVNWRFEDEGVVIASQRLQLSDEHVSASGRFSFYMPFDRDQQPLLNLQIGMRNSDALQAKYYVPPQEVGVETYDWLVDAIQQGHINRAGFILNGVTRSRLDDYQMPVVQLFFDVSQASFKYQEGWPQVQNANAFIYFRNGELLVRAHGGKLYDSKIDSAWAYLLPGATGLRINGQLSGDAKDLKRVITESPVREFVGEGLDDWQMSGNTVTRLALALPLQGGKVPDVYATADFNGAELTSVSDRLAFSKIKGQLRFNSATGVSAPHLKGELFGEPVSASVSTHKERTEVKMSGSIQAAKLKNWLDLELLNVASGKFGYQAELDICPASRCNQLQIKSDLKGVSLMMPSPFAKPADSPMKLVLSKDLRPGQKLTHINLADQLRGVIDLKQQQVQRARFTLGGERPLLPVDRGIWVDGRVAVLDSEQLTLFLEKSGLTAKSDDDKVEEKSSEDLFRQLDLKIGRFTLDDFYLDQLEVALLPAENHWQLMMKSSALEGDLTIPLQQEQPYKLNLKHLTLNEKEKAETEGDVPLESDLKPSDLPLLDVEIADLILNEKSLGNWQFKLRPTQHGAQIKEIEALFYDAVLKGEVRWDKNGKELSELTLKLDSDNFSKVLSAWGYSDAIETSDLESYVQLSWPGAPWDYDLAKVGGEIQFNAKKGRLLDVGKSGNFLRVFGILNLHSLGRRLRLDFSDLLKSGIAFDEMSASYALEQGIAHSIKPFVLKGPSANMALTGALDLIEETVDKEIEVALPVTDNIPLVSVLLGAPQVAGAVFILDKLMGEHDPIDKFSTFRYHLTGDWSEPNIDVYDRNKSSQGEEQPFQDSSDG